MAARAKLGAPKRRSAFAGCRRESHPTNEEKSKSCNEHSVASMTIQYSGPIVCTVHNDWLRKTSHGLDVRLGTACHCTEKHLSNVSYFTGRKI